MIMMWSRTQCIFVVICSCVSLGKTAPPPGGNVTKYSTWMLESIISRDEGVTDADGLLSEINKGIFQEALRSAIGWSKDERQIDRWTGYLEASVEYGVDVLTNATADAIQPLDRFGIGRSFISRPGVNVTNQPAIDALRASVDLQLYNANGGLWYYSNPPPPYINWPNLSYCDGMYSFPPFATLYGLEYGDAKVNVDFAAFQQELVYQHTLHNDTGLLVHGYDASKGAPWADPVTGGSPIVWGRSLAWFMTGLVDSLAIAETSNATRQTGGYRKMRQMYTKVSHAVVGAISRSAHQTGRYGIWQVVDQPGREGNYVESSSTSMLLYALLRGLRYGYLDVKKTHQHYGPDIRGLLRATYDDVVDNFVVQNVNGTLDFDGTVIICSLHVQSPYYEYYVGRPTQRNALIGTSAFILASLEFEHM